MITKISADESPWANLLAYTNQFQQRFLEGPANVEIGILFPIFVEPTLAWGICESGGYACVCNVQEQYPGRR